MIRNSEKKDTETSALLRQYLKGAGETQSSLATAAGTSAVYVNFIATGRRVPSPRWVDLIADNLKLTAEQRGEMHRAAAKDHGFKIDLT